MLTHYPLFLFSSSVFFFCATMLHAGPSWSRLLYITRTRVTASVIKLMNKKATSSQWATLLYETERVEMLQKPGRSTDNFGERQSRFAVSFGPEEMVNTSRMSGFRDERLWNSFLLFFIYFLFTLSLKPRKQTCPAGSLTAFAFPPRRRDEWPLSLMCESVLV